MKPLVLGVTLTLVGPTVWAQQAAPNAIEVATAPGIQVRYLNFGWNPEAFAAMEKGGAHPAAGRSWVLARLVFSGPMKWQGKIMGAAFAYLLVLNPARGGQPMTLEVRRVDMREIFLDLNVIAEPPEGPPVHIEPAGFKQVDQVAEKLAVALKEAGNKVLLSVHYGDRQATIELTR